MTTQLHVPFQLGEPQTVRGITLTPLFPLRDPVCRYVSLDRALATGLRISEVDEAGDVGELDVRNPLETSVLLYDGEELSGAKQNRILNLSVMVAPGSRTRIPVSCVERGRWSWRDRRFSAARHVVSPELRRRKAASLRSDACAPGAAQMAVWATVDEQLALRQVSSATAANADGFVARASEIAAVTRSLKPEPGQCGVVASLPGRGWCLDAVSRPDVFAELYPKLAAGYVYDILDDRADVASAADAFDVLATGRVSRRPSVAMGDDLWLEGKGVIASGLEVDGELVQLSGYAEPVCR